MDLLSRTEAVVNTKRYARRQFLNRSAGAGALLLTPRRWLAASTPAKRTAADQVTLGNTGLKLSRLGFGTGSNRVQVQHDLGQEQFNSLIHCAYDQGITYFACAQSYHFYLLVTNQKELLAMTNVPLRMVATNQDLLRRLSPKPPPETIQPR